MFPLTYRIFKIFNIFEDQSVLISKNLDFYFFSLLFDDLVTILSILVLLDLFSMLQYRYKNSQNLNLCTEQGNVALEPYQQG